MVKWLFLCTYHFLLYPTTFLLAHVFWPVWPKRFRDSLRLKWLRSWPRSSVLLLNKEGNSEKDVDISRPLLIHAASGEIEYAKPLIRAWRAKYPNSPIIVTYSSPSFENLFRQDLDQQIFTTPLPFDFFLLQYWFLKRYRPQAIAIARTDAWLGLLHAASALGIPSLLFAATVSEASDQVSALPRYYKKIHYSLFAKIAVVSDEDAEALAQLTDSHRISVTGDPRYDQAWWRLYDKPQPTLLPQAQGLRGILASLWPEDTSVLLAGLKAGLASASYPSSSSGHKSLGLIKEWVIVPHEPEDKYIKPWEEFFKSRGFKLVRLSALLKNKSLSNPLEVTATLKEGYPTHQQLESLEVESPGIAYIVDQVGYLARLYLECHFAFVGGSFRSKVHSVMEPLCAGVPVSVGPYHTNNREAVEFLQIELATGINAVTCITNAHDFLNWLAQLAQLYENPAPHHRSKELLLQHIQRRLGATSRILTLMNSMRG